MPQTGFEPAIPAGERPQTYALRLHGCWDRPFQVYRPKFCLHLSSLTMRTTCQLFLFHAVTHINFGEEYEL